MKKLFIIISLVAFSGCSEENGNSVEGTNIDNRVTLFLKTVDGINLLNTQNYNSNNFKIFYKENNEFIEVNNPNLDYPRNFFINNETNPISMKLFLNHSKEATYPITLIKWNETETDTIKAYFRRGIENNIEYDICEKIWLNDNIVWDLTYPSGITGREFTIIK